MDSTAWRQLLLLFKCVMVQHLSLEESCLVRGLFRILGLSASLGGFFVGVEVLDHATNDVHYLPVRLRITQVKRVDDAGQLEQILNALLVLLRLVVVVLVHQDVQADLLDEIAVLLHRDALREALGLLSPLAVHGCAPIQEHFHAFTGTCYILLGIVIKVVVWQYT